MKWPEHNKITSLTRFTSHLDISGMRFYDSFYVKQANSKAFHIVYIAGRDAMEFFKNVTEIFFGYANTFILTRDKNTLAIAVC